MQSAEKYNVYVQFASNSRDIRQISVCDRLTMPSFDTLVRESFERHYTEMPEIILYYVRKKLKHGGTVMVKAESVHGFFYDDAIVVAYGLWDDRDDRFPSYISKRVEQTLFDD